MSPASSNPQLPLSITLHDDATFENFFEGNNVSVVSVLKRSLTGKTDPFIYLWGAEGVGRSHLLQACCHAMDEARSALYLDLKKYESFTPDILLGMDQVDLVCIDNINAVLGRKDWEEALFHFYNRAHDRKIHLIVSGSMVPTQLSCQLPDLRSRLSWGLVFQVKPLSDEQKHKALMMRARNRGLILSDSAAQFLLTHMPRNLKTLFNTLEILEKASLVEQRRITVPFIKSILT